MPWCPNCGIEYTEEYKECPQCHIDLTDELWETDAELDKANEEANRKRKKIIRAISLMIVLVFTLFILGNIIRFFNYPSIDFLSKSWELALNQEIRDAQKTIVRIKSNTREGTGFNISPDGLIITNYHVVKDAPSVTITFSNGKMFSAKEWTSSPEKDLAFIKIKGKDLPALRFEEDNPAAVGDMVTIIGNPLGFQRVVTQGEVISISSMVKGIDVPVLTIKGTIHPGSSGSPVINDNNRVVGVIFATLTPENSENKEDINGLAIPVYEIDIP